MAYIKVYSDENKRHPDLMRAMASQEQVEKLLPTVLRSFKLPTIDVHFNKRGGGHFRHEGYKRALHLALSKKNSWLLVAHEVAHYLTWVERKAEISRLQEQLDETAPDERGSLVEKRDELKRRGHHTKDFAANVDLVAQFIRSQKWHESDIIEVLDMEKLTKSRPSDEQPWYKKIDLVKETFRQLPDRLFCPRCNDYKEKDDFGVRVTSRSVDGFPTRVIRQSYCRPCRSKKG